MLTLLWLLASVPASMAQSGGFDPVNPPDPQPGNSARRYTLTLKCAPEDGGNINNSGGKVHEGSTVNLYAYGNGMYRFGGWVCGNDTISRSASLSYTMPGHDVTLTAAFVFDPDSPVDPDQQRPKYMLTLKASPEDGGGFSTGNTRITAGETVTVRAYANSHYKFRHWLRDGAKIASTVDYSFEMPEHPVELTGEFLFNPSNPSNPLANYWNKDLGEAIIDDFNPGNLSSTLSNLVNSNGSYADLVSLTVAGVINDYDFGFSRSYGNMLLLDLSRTSGVNYIPSYEFESMQLESVSLPSSIEKIGYRAFANCSGLTSLTCYATTPPTLEQNVFQNTDALTVYVPATAVGDYQKADGWKDFTILPISEDIRSLSVVLPESADPSSFARMWLELVNVRSGQRMHYVMTDRRDYTFSNLIRRTTWDVLVRNERGDIFGRLDGVELGDEDRTVTLHDLKAPKKVVFKATRPADIDVTDLVKVTWTDRSGLYVGQGSGLEGIPEGMTLTARPVLGQELAMAFSAPDSLCITVNDGDNTVNCRLTPIGSVTVSGRVLEGSTRMPLEGAVVTASQTFGGKYTSSVTAVSGADGRWQLTCADVPTSLSVALQQYVTHVEEHIDTVWNHAEQGIIPDIALHEISGTVINLKLSYRESVADGETADSRVAFDGATDIDYAVRNVTTSRPVGRLSVQYPSIVLLEETAEGDILEVTASSRTGAFAPVTARGTVSGDTVSVDIPIVEPGHLRVTFGKTENTSVTATLYDASGKYIGAAIFDDDATAEFSGLPDGRYTVVAMATNSLFSTLTSLSLIGESGLTDGTDYCQTSADVKAGRISAVDFPEVPMLDINGLYTTTASSLSVNKPTIVVGNYLTLSSKVEFRPAYAGQVSEVELIFDLPAETKFVEKSAMVGNSVSNYALEGNRLAVPLNRANERVRFCILPLEGGELTATASVRFRLDGKQITQPLGTVGFSVRNLSLTAPGITASTTVPVRGLGKPNSTVEIFDNDVLVGRTTVLPDGTWATECALHEPFNLSEHRINARVTDKTGTELMSESSVCVYNADAIVVSKVDMIYGSIVLPFDFLCPSSTTGYYSFVPSQPDFTFAVNFTQNDTEKISDVVVNVKTSAGTWVAVPAEWNDARGCWAGTAAFNSSAVPVNVAVSYIADNAVKVDRNAVNEVVGLQDDILGEFSHGMEEIDRIFASGDRELIQQFLDSLGFTDEYFEPLCDIDLEAFAAMTEAQQEAYLAELFTNASVNEEFDKMYGSMWNGPAFNPDWTDMTVNGVRYRRESVADVNPESLLAQGFEQFNLTDGTEVWMKSDGAVFEWIDPSAHQRIVVEYPPEIARSLVAAMKSGKLTSETIREWTKKLNDALGVVEGTVKDLNRKVENFLGPIYKELHRLGLEKARYVNLKKTANPAMLHVYNQELEKIEEALARARFLKDCFKKVSKAIAKYMPVAKYALIVSDAVIDLNKLWNLYKSIPDPCPNMPSEAAALQEDIAWKAGAVFSYYIGYVGVDMALSSANVLQLIAGIPSGGATVVTAIISELAKLALQTGIDAAKSYMFGNYLKQTRSKINKLKCRKEPPPPPGGGKPGSGGKPGGGKPGGGTPTGGAANTGEGDLGDPSNNPDQRFGIDPSGFVYEGVFSNRLEGVTATAYYKEEVEDMYGDIHENIVKWDAAAYAQENPLFTDADGFYQWDVPPGLWQVKYEKEGYETAHSEWLPVPPPQLEVNIGMVQRRQPVVADAVAYEQAVEFRFDKYMIAELLDTDNISVLVDGKPVAGTVKLQDEEVSYEGNTDTYARHVRFEAAEPFASSEVTLMVRNRVKSYAGVRMQDDFIQSFGTQTELKAIEVPEAFKLESQVSADIKVSVRPADAAAGRSVTAVSASPLIAGIEPGVAIVGADGTASFTVTAWLPGTTTLSFSLDGTSLKGSTELTVASEILPQVEMPEASIASGSTVQAFTTLSLTCATPDAYIWYTLDGSCPCDDTPARRLFDPDRPIEMRGQSMTVHAMAVANGMSDSPVAEWHYTVVGDSGTETIDADSDSVDLWPVPVSDVLNVRCASASINRVTVTSVDGATVEVVDAGAPAVRLNATQWPAGVLIVTVSTDSATVSRKIIKR